MLILKRYSASKRHLLLYVEELIKMSNCNNCCGDRPAKDAKYNNLVVCGKLANKDLSAQRANIANLTVGDLTILGDTVVNNFTFGCGFDVPSDYPTIQEAVDAALASGEIVVGINICAGTYVEDVTIAFAVPNMALALNFLGGALVLGNLLVTGSLSTPIVIGSAGSVSWTGSMIFDGVPGHIRNLTLNARSSPGIALVGGARPNFSGVRVRGDDLVILSVDSGTDTNIDTSNFNNNSTTLPTVLNNGGEISMRACQISNGVPDSLAYLLSSDSGGGGSVDELVGCEVSGTIVSLGGATTFPSSGGIRIVGSLVGATGSVRYAVEAGDLSGGVGAIEIYNSHVTSVQANVRWAAVINLTSRLRYSQISHPDTSNPRVDLLSGAMLAQVEDTTSIFPLTVGFTNADAITAGIPVGGLYADGTGADPALVARRF
jgi:hypothetical protein